MLKLGALLAAGETEKGPETGSRLKTGSVGRLGVAGNTGLEGVLEDGGAFWSSVLLRLARSMSSLVVGAMRGDGKTKETVACT
jgi:hypothetical protein